MSTTFRDMANNKTHRHQWIVLDGDIDAEWIESMNTVMDDNKVNVPAGVVSRCRAGKVALRLQPSLRAMECMSMHCVFLTSPLSPTG